MTFETRDFLALRQKIKAWGHQLGFSALGIARADVASAAPALLRWLALGRHGGMDYMAKHAALRIEPTSLQAGTLSIISARLPYWCEPKNTHSSSAQQVLANPNLAYISRYALGRDYHRVMRTRLQKLAELIDAELKISQPTLNWSYRAFSDSAPVMEVELARQAGIAWRGKHTLSLTQNGSWHFLGELYTSLPFPADQPMSAHCGRCTRCIDVCPTQAIVAPYEVDARLCISYLTIELAGSIPLALRPLIGNRIYGCDDCQLCCPWNRFAHIGDPAFAARQGLEASQLSELFAWSASEFNDRLAGSPIRRIGHERWLRNIAVALGNSHDNGNNNDLAQAALRTRLDDPSALVREHVAWAIR